MSLCPDSVDGLLAVAKPCGPTSRDIVNLVQRQVRPNKVGHAGTLDPLASGVLVLGVGTATRLIQYVQRSTKQYLGDFQLGVASATDDLEGIVHEQLSGVRVPDRSDVEEVLPRFHGDQWQVPPDFSAVKVEGRRAYDLARQGEQLTLTPRRVVIHSIELVEYQYPRMRLSIVCGGGTYVRALGRDIARSLGTSAVMTSLVREAVGPFRLEQAHAVASLASCEDIRSALLPLKLAVSGLPCVQLDDEQCRFLLHGRSISHPGPAGGGSTGTGEVAVLNPRGDLLGVAIAGSGSLRPRICLTSPSPSP